MRRHILSTETTLIYVFKRYKYRCLFNFECIMMYILIIFERVKLFCTKLASSGSEQVATLHLAHGAQESVNVKVKGLPKNNNIRLLVLLFT